MRLVLFVHGPADAWHVQRRRLPVADPRAAGAQVGHSVLLCERRDQTLEYFALARLAGHVLDPDASNAQCLCLDCVSYFERPVRVLNASGSMVLGEGGSLHREGERIGWIPEAEFSRLAQAGGLPAEAGAARSGLEQGFAEQQAALWTNDSYTGIVARPDRSDLAAQTLAAYGQRCAVSNLRIVDRQGTQCDAIAIAIPAVGGRAERSESVSDMICLSPTWAFLMRAGLMAIAGDYTVQVKDAFIADVVLAQLPQTGKIRLPERKDHWPDPEALARHCGTFFR